MSITIEQPPAKLAAVDPPLRVDVLRDLAAHDGDIPESAVAATIWANVDLGWLTLEGIPAAYRLYDELVNLTNLREQLDDPRDADVAIAAVLWELTHAPGQTPDRWADRVIGFAPDVFRTADPTFIVERAA